jgi:hypothetical protein
MWWPHTWYLGRDVTWWPHTWYLGRDVTWWPQYLVSGKGCNVVTSYLVSGKGCNVVTSRAHSKRAVQSTEMFDFCHNSCWRCIALNTASAIQLYLSLIRKLKTFISKGAGETWEKKVTTLSAEGQKLKVRAAKLHSVPDRYTNFIVWTAAMPGSQPDQIYLVSDFRICVTHQLLE